MSGQLNPFFNRLLGQDTAGQIKGFKYRFSQVFGEQQCMPTFETAAVVPAVRLNLMGWLRIAMAVFESRSQFKG